MNSPQMPQLSTLEAWTDEEVVKRVLAGETGAFEVIMRRYNQRLFRVALGIVGEETEAEDVTQEAYVRAFEHLSQFAGRSKFSTWLTRIAVHEALARLRHSQRTDSLQGFADETGEPKMSSTTRDPEKLAADGEMKQLLEQALLALPAAYRSVIMLRDVQEMSTSEAAEVLDLSEDNLKVRLHRARAALREQLYELAGPAARCAFAFAGPRCERLTRAVLSRIAAQARSSDDQIL